MIKTAEDGGRFCVLFVGYAYNAEETNAVIGLQYLRARYYDTDIGAFITIDAYLGSLTDVTSQNRYTYTVLEKSIMTTFYTKKPTCSFTSRFSLSTKSGHLVGFCCI